MKKVIVVGVAGVSATSMQDVARALARAGCLVLDSGAHQAKEQAADPLVFQSRGDFQDALVVAPVGGDSSSPWYRRQRNGKPVRY